MKLSEVLKLALITYERHGHRYMCHNLTCMYEEGSISRLQLKIASDFCMYHVHSIDPGSCSLYGALKERRVRFEEEEPGTLIYSRLIEWLEENPEANTEVP